MSLCIKNLASFKLNEDVKVNIFYQNDFMSILLCVILSAYALYENDKFMGRPCMTNIVKKSKIKQCHCVFDCIFLLFLVLF
jgi:hypothetical protein